ncbi:hypothetical protein N7G274_007082 [Stereocaulon virgatum]|uniref:Rhodopsin domain-containing protein n=1 Tax=Stereocaulon virgatum TaxID=373712 RepID=A0ABR4A3U6_9LECA
MTSSPGNPYLSESRQPQLYGAYTSTYALAIISVCLRITSRKHFTKAGIWLDDYVIFAALACASAAFVNMVIWVHRGLGRHIELYGPAGVKHFYLGLFVTEIFYTMTLCLTKFSILLFYLRIFARTTIRIPIAILGLIITAWAIAVVATTIFQCRPVQGFWDKSMNPTCAVNVYAYFIGKAIPNIITDWALLFLPIPYIWRLHQSRAQKVALCGVFGLGGFISMLSIIRLAIMVTQLLKSVSDKDVTWLFIASSTWTAVEFNLGIVSACLPSFRPLLVAIFGDSAFTPNQRIAGKTSKKSHASYPSRGAHDAWPDTLQETYIRAGSGSGSIKDVEMDNILTSEGRVRSRDVLVTHDVKVVGSAA